MDELQKTKSVIFLDFYVCTRNSTQHTTVQKKFSKVCETQTENSIYSCYWRRSQILIPVRDSQHFGVKISVVLNLLRQGSIKKYSQSAITPNLYRLHLSSYYGQHSIHTACTTSQQSVENVCNDSCVLVDVKSSHCWAFSLPSSMMTFRQAQNTIKTEFGLKSLVLKELTILASNTSKDELLTYFYQILAYSSKTVWVNLSIQMSLLLSHF